MWARKKPTFSPVGLSPLPTDGTQELEYAGLGTGISPTFLRALAQPRGLSVRRAADDGALVLKLAAHETIIGAPSAYQARAIIR